MLNRSLGTFRNSSKALSGVVSFLTRISAAVRLQRVTRVGFWEYVSLRLWIKLSAESYSFTLE